MPGDSVLAALRKVIEQEGVFCALYSDRASHFFWTPRAGWRSIWNATQAALLTQPQTGHIVCSKKRTF